MNLLTSAKNALKKQRKVKMIIISLRKKANIFFIKKHISGINNKIEYKDAILKNTTFEIIGNNNSIVVMKDCRLENVTFYIRGNDNSIILHDHVQYNGTLWTVCNNGCIDIGMHTTTEHNVNMQIAEDDMKIEVGNDCMFSSNISIWTQDWHKIYDENEERINNAKNVKIKNHVWIGYDSKILKGVIIGNNNIIGANTVVTKSYEEENVVIAGNPGKIVKRGINWKR